MKIDKYLTQGEVIDKTFSLKGYDIHATNKRLFVSYENGKVVQDYDYNHISSIAFHLKRYYWLLALGGAIVIASWFLTSNMSFSSNSEWRWIGIAIGIGVIVLGILLKKERLSLFVIGYGRVGLEGKRSELDGLFVTIREKKQVITPTTKID